MQRRAFLATVASVLGAGCMGNSSRPATSTRTSSSRGTSSSETEESTRTATGTSAFSGLFRRSFGEWFERNGGIVYRVTGVGARRVVEHDEHGRLELPDGRVLALVRYDVENRGEGSLSVTALDAHVLGSGAAFVTRRGFEHEDADGSVGLEAVDVERSPAWAAEDVPSGEVGAFVACAVVPESAVSGRERVGVTDMGGGEFNVLYSPS